MNVLVSCFNSSITIVLREEYVSLSDGPMTYLCVGPTALFFILASACLIVYSARILEGFHLIRYKIYHPPNDSLHRFVATVNHLSMDYPLLALPLRDREVISFHDRLPCIVCVYCFIVRTHHLDLLSKLLAYYLAT